VLCLYCRQSTISSKGDDYDQVINLVMNTLTLNQWEDESCFTIRYVRAFTESAKSAGSLLLQYPLYGGIMALLAYVPAKGIDPLQTVLAKNLVEAASVGTLPFWNYIGSGIITMFVPSGGGHWGVQGPISVEAALALGQSSPQYLGKVAMSVAFGEQVFNMIQPFWALPILALAKLSIRDIMGYCVMGLLVSFVIFGLSLLIL
jgi:short-chain fatty acids transporter